MSLDTFSSIIGFIKSLYPNENPIPLHAPRFWGNEKKYVLDALDSTFVSSVGEYVNRFEKMICEITNAQYAIATVNGTSALHIALKLIGVQSGEEVLTQPLTFIATANAIVYCNAEPIFLDVDMETLGLSPKSVESFLNKNAKIKDGNCYNIHTGKRIAGCVPMHTFGHPCRIDAIVKVCDDFHVPVVEDAAESIGSLYKGKHTGLFGKLGIFSFNGNKTVTCGGGGAIVTNDMNIAKRAKHITTTARIGHPYEYDHDEIGYNYRMPNINAALACAQLEQLDDFIANKRELAEKYADFFQTTGLYFVREPKNVCSNYWLEAIICHDRNERDKFIEATNDKGVTTRPCWRGLHKLKMFRDCKTDILENATWLDDRVVNIPSSVRSYTS